MQVKLNQTYYKSWQGIFFTEKTDFDLLKKSLQDAIATDAQTKKPVAKYDADAIKLILQKVKNADAFYFSSRNLVFYIKNGVVFYTKQGASSVQDIATACKITDIENKMQYDADFDAIYKRKTSAKSSATDAQENADALAKLCAENAK